MHWIRMEMRKRESNVYSVLVFAGDCTPDCVLSKQVLSP